MKKYYEEAKYNAAFDRCVDVMTRLMQKYGHQVLEKQEKETLKIAECSEEDRQSQPIFDKAACKLCFMEKRKWIVKAGLSSCGKAQA